MSHIVQVPLRRSVNTARRQHFYRALVLNTDVGSQIMRDLIGNYLKRKGMNLKEHIQEPRVKHKIEEYKHLSREQFLTLNESCPSLNKMDVSLLTVLLLNIFPEQLSDDAKKCVMELRNIRNKLAHAVQAEFDDDSVFKTSSQNILTLAKEVGTKHEYQKDVFKTINDIRNQEVVYSYCNLERVKLNNEMYVLKLVESNEEVRADERTVWKIKIGLTKWVRQLSRGLVVETFLHTLKEKEVISDTTKRKIEEEYSNEDQMLVLVLYMMNETKYNLCKFCECLRELSAPLADLVENSNSDGREIQDYLKTFEREQITRILKENLIEKVDESVTSESLHIYVEDKMGFTMAFNVIKTYVLETFSNVRHTPNDFSFLGLSWKEENDEQMNQLDDTVQKALISEMTCEEFATFASEWFKSERITVPLRTAITEQIISPKVFVEMTKDDMEEVFAPYLENAETTTGEKVKYGFGVETGLMKIKRQIVSEGITADTTDSLEVLRPFDSNFSGTNYRQRQVRPRQGHFLIPAHEFRHMSASKIGMKHYVVKEVVRFVAACINGRKNGTIHFGIEPLGNGTGQIHGLPCKRWQSGLNVDIGKAIDICFKDNANIAFKCIRPVYLIAVEGAGVVIEVDVVPFSIYLTTALLKVAFPPKGNQIEQYYVYSLKPEIGILPVSDDKSKAVEEVYKKALYERRKLEDYNDHTIDRSSLLVKQLQKMLTGGKNYVTDAYVPIIVTGKVSGSSNEFDIRTEIEAMSMAFTSSILVLDCDDSVQLRKRIENGKRIFHVKMAENLLTDSEISHSGSTWLYVNGNKELSKGAMTIESWMDNRAEGVRKALENAKERIPKSRAKVIFMMYNSVKTDKDLLKEIARMTFISYFKNQCIVIAEKEEDVVDLKNELTSLLGHDRIENSFHTGISWRHLSRLMRTVFKFNPSVVCKLPHCDGHYVEMTVVEREELNFTDIEILSGEECNDREASIDSEEKKSMARKEQENFYHGSPVSWWNFYFQQVGERDLFLTHKNEIKDKLQKQDGETLIELHEIEHQPGAGGTTLGRHLLWYFSQFRRNPEKSYRCCVIKTSNVTDETIHQIEVFRNFKDGECPKPFIVLADNKIEECENYLKAKLHELAYKTSSPGKLFCLILMINRKPISYDETDSKPLLRHLLSSREQIWFEEKYKQMEKSRDVNVETLIAFNCMRHSFHPEYMKRTVDQLVRGVPKTEMVVLRCLALISAFDKDSHVPESVFDSMMDTLKIEIVEPWGIAHSFPELQRMAKSRNEPWNTQISRAMNLLIVNRRGRDFYSSGISLVSQLLAKTVLEYIKMSENVTLENIVNNTLEIVKTHAKETNPMSKRFVRIVCSLFKTRQLLEGDGMELKQKFSELVLELENKVAEESEKDANGRVLRTMRRCFDITNDPLVGQQLARFNIHIKDYETAKDVIEQSLEIQMQNSYLLHTYGQIFKSKMENMLNNASQGKSKIQDCEGAQIIDLAHKAIEKFVKGQEVAISCGDNTTWGCAYTEIKTALTILEKFQSFACYTNRKDFISFLNDDISKVADGPLLKMLKRCPDLQNFRVGSDAQYHIETSLRSLEERSYQIKRKLYVIYSEDETLLLGLRERYERFYGSQGVTDKYQFSFGLGLKPLMVARERKKESLTKRVTEAKVKLAETEPSKRDLRDLLVYVGDKIISISKQGPRRDTGVCDENEYRLLLSYSSDLISLQTAEPEYKRLYLESFLYYAMLHWPLKSRTQSNFRALARPAAYEQIIKRWEEAYNKNFYIKTREQQQRYRPKNYFALGKGSPGNEIVDLKSIEREWIERKKRVTGRVRRPVFKDFFWREDFVEERLERLQGFVDESGNNVTHQAEYSEGFHTFRIRTYYPCSDLSNRSVTFVLGFTWKEPTAFDVKETGNVKGEYPEDTEGSDMSGQADGISETLYERVPEEDQKSGSSVRLNPRRRKRNRRLNAKSSAPERK